MITNNYDAIKAKRENGKKRFVCAECGSSNVQIRAWVNMNTNEYCNDCDDDEVWCEDCQDYVDVKEVED